MRKFIYILLPVLFIYTTNSSAQNIDVADLWSTIKAKQFVKVNGGVSASLIYHDGNRAEVNRQPWVYNLNGNLNITVLKNFSIPISYNLTNVGGSYSYPTFPNRLSLHPTYKWVTAHIGDFTMSFSPYTFNGHQVRGGGLDVTIKEKLKLSAFYGTLSQPVQYDSSNKVLPAAYKRIGYGLNALYTDSKLTTGFSYFIGKDIENSIEKLNDSLRIYPKQNVALGARLGYRFTKNFDVEGEYGLSITTNDARINEQTDKGLNFLNQVKTNSSSEQQSAYKLRLAYTFLKNVIGVGYERVAPGYQTMGAYYFNNDFENFTLDYARTFFKGKTQFSAKGGLQQDNLDRAKTSTTQRYIGSAQISTSVGKKIQLSLSYSNFQNYMKVRSQFDNINQSLPVPRGDSLNYIQVNNNANVSITYMLQRTKERVQNILLKLNFQKSSNKQGGQDIADAGVTMYNTMLGYNVNFIPKRISLTASWNTTITRMVFNTLIYGPTVSVNKRLLKDQVVVGLSTSYNRSEMQGSLQTEIINLRGNIGFTYKKRHTLSQTSLYQFRNLHQKSSTDGDFTGTLTYSYNF